MESHRVGELKEQALRRSIKMYTIIFSIFLIIGFTREDLDPLTNFLLIFGAFVGMVVIRLVALQLISYSIENTVIEVDGERITRSGEGLLRSSMLFNEIGKVKKNEIGLLLLKKGLSAKIGYNLSKTAYSTEPDIIYIPDH